MKPFKQNVRLGGRKKKSFLFGIKQVLTGDEGVLVQVATDQVKKMVKNS